MNKKFWEAVKRGDDIQILCHPDDSPNIEKILKPFSNLIEEFGPFAICESKYVEPGTIVFINNSLHKEEAMRQFKDLETIQMHYWPMDNETLTDLAGNSNLMIREEGKREGE